MDSNNFSYSWFIMEAHFSDKYKRLLEDLFKLFERRITRLEKSVK
jgi:hypothetical protein